MVGVEPRGPTRAEPGLGLPEPFEQRPVGVQGLPVPADRVSAGQDLNGGAVLVQQGRRLQGGLPGAVYHDIGVPWNPVRSVYAELCAHAEAGSAERGPGT